MATLTGNSIASTYTGLLSVSGAVGADTVEAVTDGAGTSTSLSLSQQRATITLGSGAGDDFIVDGTTLVVEGDNNRVGIGTTSPQGHLEINTELEEDTKVRINGEVGYAKRLEIRHFDASELGLENNMLFIASKAANTGTLGHVDSSATDVDVLTWTQEGDVTVSTGDIVIPTADKGISFTGGTDPDTSGTATGNILNDYEEGTWTPAVSGSVTAGNTTYTAASTVGRYEKIGRQVTVRGRVKVSTMGTLDGDVSITGLPFTANSDVSTFGTLSFSHGGSLNITAGTIVSALITVGGTTAAINIWDVATGTTSMDDAELTGGADMIFSGTYHV